LDTVLNRFEEEVTELPSSDELDANDNYWDSYSLKKALELKEALEAIQV
jgi:hypothetical protein